MKKILAVVAFSVLASGASFAQEYGNDGDCKANAAQAQKRLNETKHSQETIDKVTAYIEQARKATGPSECDAAIASAMELLKM